MTNIASVIGWKFNHQAGMSTKDGVITAFPGGIPSQADQDTWTAEYEASLPTKAWEEAMAGTDAIPRWAEDIISGDPPAQSTLDAVAAKKALRLTKP
jgi:hypothetical protein